MPTPAGADNADGSNGDGDCGRDSQEDECRRGQTEPDPEGSDDRRRAARRTRRTREGTGLGGATEPHGATPMNASITGAASTGPVTSRVT